MILSLSRPRGGGGDFIVLWDQPLRATFSEEQMGSVSSDMELASVVGTMVR